MCEKCGHENKWIYHEAQSALDSKYEVVIIENDEIEVNLRPNTLGDKVIYEANLQCRRCDEIHRITLEV